MIAELLDNVYERSRSKGNTIPLLLSLISIVLFVAMATRVANSVNVLRCAAICGLGGVGDLMVELG